MITIHLTTNLTALQKLHELAEKGKTVRINSEDLQRLLIDHSVMFRALTDHSSVQVKEPRTREKL